VPLPRPMFLRLFDEDRRSPTLPSSFHPLVTQSISPPSSPPPSPSNLFSCHRVLRFGVVESGQRYTSNQSLEMVKHNNYKPKSPKRQYERSTLYVSLKAIHITKRNRAPLPIPRKMLRVYLYRIQPYPYQSKQPLQLTHIKPI
jgi:hypothetical protein